MVIVVAMVIVSIVTAAMTIIFLAVGSVCVALTERFDSKRLCDFVDEFDDPTGERCRPPLFSLVIDKKILFCNMNPPTYNLYVKISSIKMKIT